MNVTSQQTAGTSEIATDAPGIQEYADKLKGVNERFLNEFNMGNKKDFCNDGPAPNLKTRKLIFDSMKTLAVDSRADAGDSGSGKGIARHVYVCGAGYQGQLGRKPSRSQKKYATLPIPVLLDAGIRQIACGSLHTAVVTDAGKILTWGDNSHNQLGHSGVNYVMCSIPTEVFIEGGPVATAACGQYHTVCVTKSDQVYSWGHGKNGQLGVGRAKDMPHPTLVVTDDENFQNIKQISCGDRHTIFVTEAGRIFSCGSDKHGQIGHSSSTNGQLVPKVVKCLFKEKIIQACCGSIHTAAITDSGKVYVWGFGEHFYGVGTVNFHFKPKLIDFGLKNKIIQVACGQGHILLLTDEGNVHAYGDGDCGEIGQGAFKPQFKPVLVLLGKKIISISCGRYHSAALSNTGLLYTWGCGDNGQLGRAQSSQDSYVKHASSVPKVVNSLMGNIVGSVSCGEHHTCVIASCRYLEIPPELQELGILEEMEFEFKKNITSRNRGRGIPRGDIFKIRRWRRDEERRSEEKRVKDRKREERKAQFEKQKITSPKDFKKALNRKVRELKLNDDSSREKRQPSMRSNNSSLTNTMPEQKSAHRNAMSPIEENVTLRDRRTRKPAQSIRVMSTTQAVQAQYSFHHKNTNLYHEMGNTIFRIQHPVVDGKAMTQEDMLKRKFKKRKEFDKIRLITRQKESQLRELNVNLAMFLESCDSTEADSLLAQDLQRDLKMKLNTVNIKINEAERNRTSYELNISNTKDEEQENHKLLDLTRRQLNNQETLKRKIIKFHNYVCTQRDLSTQGVHEFQHELDDWRNFLNLMKISIHDVARGKKENEAKQRDAELKRSIEMKRSKVFKRIDELRTFVSDKEELMRESEKIRLDIVNDINVYKNIFDELNKATNKNDPSEIIFKYELNKEIFQEYSKTRDRKLQKYKELKKELQEITEHFDSLKANKKDHSWKEVDKQQELYTELEVKLNNKKTKSGTYLYNFGTIKRMDQFNYFKI